MKIHEAGFDRLWQHHRDCLQAAFLVFVSFKLDFQANSDEITLNFIQQLMAIALGYVMMVLDPKPFLNDCKATNRNLQEWLQPNLSGSPRLGMASLTFQWVLVVNGFCSFMVETFWMCSAGQARKLEGKRRAKYLPDAMAAVVRGLLARTKVVRTSLHKSAKPVLSVADTRVVVEWMKSQVDYTMLQRNDATGYVYLWSWRKASYVGSTKSGRKPQHLGNPFLFGPISRWLEHRQEILTNSKVPKRKQLEFKGLKSGDDCFVNLFHGPLHQARVLESKCLRGWAPGGKPKSLERRWGRSNRRYQSQRQWAYSGSKATLSKLQENQKRTYRSNGFFEKQKAARLLEQTAIGMPVADLYKRLLGEHVARTGEFGPLGMSDPLRLAILADSKRSISWRSIGIRRPSECSRIYNLARKVQGCG